MNPTHMFVISRRTMVAWLKAEQELGALRATERPKNN